MPPDLLRSCACHGRCVLVFGVGLLMACEADHTPLDDSPTDVHTSNERAVYAAVLAQAYGASFYVIRDHTIAYSLDDSGEELASLQTEMPDLPIDMVASFCVRSATPQPLSPDMDLGAPYKLVSDQELQEIFKDLDGWERFNEKFPDAKGEIGFTSVGFSSTEDEALVRWRHQWDWLAGDGGFILLVKVDGVWRVSNMLVTLRS